MTRGRNSSGRNKEPTAETNKRNRKTAFDELSKVFFQVISVKEQNKFLAQLIKYRHSDVI